MRPDLLPLLACPVHRESLRLHAATLEGAAVVSGELACPQGDVFGIERGIPRFATRPEQRASVHSFGTEWNAFNFTDFKVNWLEHTIRNTFGSPGVFAGKLVVDCGAGSGAQSRWMAEAGAARVIALEMSHAVDDVMRRNLWGLANVDIVQCDISEPPLKDGAVDGIVLCHNVIHHTASVADTARALYRITGPGGELAFNCYARNDRGLLRKARWVLHDALRAMLSRSPEPVLRAYAWAMSRAIELPLAGDLLTRSMLAVCGDVPPGPDARRRKQRQTYLNTYDAYGSHRYQHRLSDDAVRAIVRELQPDPSLVRNMDRYFSRPQPIGIAIRIMKPC